MVNVTGTLTGSIKRGESLGIMPGALNLSITDATDTLRIVALPLHGTLRIAGKDVVVGDEFTYAEYALSRPIYLHHGLTNGPDSFSVVGVHREMIEGAEVETLSTVAVFDITISADNSGWVLVLNPLASPAIIAGWLSAKWYLSEIQIRWDEMHWGKSVLYEVTSADTALLSLFVEKDDKRLLPDLATSPISQINGSTAEGLANALYAQLIKTANADLKTLVFAYGADIELLGDIWNSLEEGQRTRWQQLRTTINANPLRRVDVHNADWYGAINLTKNMLG